MSHFKRIGLLGSLDVAEVKESLHKLESFLVSQGREVVYEEQAAKLVDWPVDKTLPIEEFAGAIDLGIVVGGDGSMLSACRKMAASGIPLLALTADGSAFSQIYPQTKSKPALCRYSTANTSRLGALC